MKLLFLALVALWLLLNQSLDPGDALLGAALALGGTLAFARLQPPASGLRFRPRVLVELLGLVLADIVRSNLAVARIVLGLHRAKRTAGFLSMPLELRDPRGLAVMACIITATPGTSWARYDAARSILTIHVLDLVDEAAWIRLFKHRYERRLLEIFQ
jgi:multicomponent K+:H+ antiporter subunit E